MSHCPREGTGPRKGRDASGRQTKETRDISTRPHLICCLDRQRIFPVVCIHHMSPLQQQSFICSYLYHPSIRQSLSLCASIVAIIHLLSLPD